MVGAPGFEPGTSCAQGRRATRLRYAPTRSALPILKHIPTLRLLRPVAIASIVPCLILSVSLSNVVDNACFRCLYRVRTQLPGRTQHCQQHFRDSRSGSRLGETSRLTRGANAGLRDAAGVEALAVLSSHWDHFPATGCISVSFWVAPLVSKLTKSFALS